MKSYKTPDVPDCIREIRHPQYRNIYEFGLGNRNLWGTESLLGDWDGKYLLIAKDFYPSSYIEHATGNDRYQHSPRARTNIYLLKTLRRFNKFQDETSNTECDFLYVSACFLLRDDGKIRGPLPDQTEVLKLSYPVLKFTIDHMPRLMHAVTMGTEASRAVRISPLPDLFRDRHIQVHRVSHPANAMTNQRRFDEWESIFGVQ